MKNKKIVVLYDTEAFEPDKVLKEGVDYFCDAEYFDLATALENLGLKEWNDLIRRVRKKNKGGCVLFAFSEGKIVDGCVCPLVRAINQIADLSHYVITDEDGHFMVRGINEYDENIEWELKFLTDKGVKDIFIGEGWGHRDTEWCKSINHGLFVKVPNIAEESKNASTT